MARAAIALVAYALVAGIGAPASADSDASERERTALYAEGVALANAGRWEEAAKRFRQVVAIRPAPPALFTLAQAEEHVGQLATAERDYESALAGARATASQSDVADAAAKAIESIALRVPWVVVRLEHPVPGAVASIDGASIPFAQPVKLDPGAHVVAAQAPENQPFERRVVLAAGESIEVPVKLQPLVGATSPSEPAAAVVVPPASESPGPAVETGPGSKVSIGAWIVAGVGVAAGVTGLVLRVAGQSSYDDASRQCPNGACASSSTVSEGNAARTRIIVGTTVLGAGIAAIVVGGVWWLTLNAPHGGASAALTAHF